MILEALRLIGTVIWNVLTKIYNVATKLWVLWVFIIIVWISYNFLGDMIIWYNTGEYPNMKDTFVAHREKLIKSNEFSQITLPNLDNYDIEISIPSGQVLHSTVQGNWGISTDPNNIGMTTGVYRDGYSADGSIFKGKSGKKYKRMLEQGPYVIRYAIRRGEKVDPNELSVEEHDVKIYINEKLIHDLKDEGIPSGQLKVVGTNYADYNTEADGTGRGRRKVDYIKFIPREKPKQKPKEGFGNKKKKKKKKRNGGIISNIQNFIKNSLSGMKFTFSYKEGNANMSDTASSPALNNAKERIRKYLVTMKADKRRVIKPRSNKVDTKKLKIYMRPLFENLWTGWKRCPTKAFYEMHMNILNGMQGNEIMDKFASEFTIDAIKQDDYYSTTGRRQKKNCGRNVMNQMAIELGYTTTGAKQAKQKLNDDFVKALRRIKENSFKVSMEPIAQGSSSSAASAASSGVPSEGQESSSSSGDGGMSEEQVIVPGGAGNMKCPLNCIQPRNLNEFCEKDIIRMVIGGEDKFFRKCGYTCKDRDAPDYVNYDKSSKNNPYNVNRDGCRNTEAHCLKTCPKSLVEVDEMGRDLYSIKNNYTKTKDSSIYAKSRLFAHKQTTGIFGTTDNRLGGSKQGYTIKYKPENPNPARGPIHYNAIWDFKP